HVQRPASRPRHRRRDPGHDRASVYDLPGRPAAARAARRSVGGPRLHARGERPLRPAARLRPPHRARPRNRARDPAGRRRRVPRRGRGAARRSGPGVPRHLPGLARRWPARRPHARWGPRGDPRAVHAQAHRVSLAVDDVSASRRLARFALGLRLADVSPPVVARAGLLVLDTLGCALAAAPTDFGRSVIATARELGGATESTIIGGSLRVGARRAVLATEPLAHGLDSDDPREDAIVHTGCAAVPTALAVAEATGASGAAALEATIAAVEVMCRVGLAVPGRFHARHFHPTSLTSSFAAAIAAGRLYGLHEDQLVHALGIC